MKDFHYLPVPVELGDSIPVMTLGFALAPKNASRRERDRAICMTEGLLYRLWTYRAKWPDARRPVMAGLVEDFIQWPGKPGLFEQEALKAGFLRQVGSDVEIVAPEEIFKPENYFVDAKRRGRR